MKIQNTSLAKLAAPKVIFGKPKVAGISGARPDNSASNSASNGWMTKGAENIAAQLEKVRIASNRKFAPEIHVKDGESKRLRFRSDDPIGTLRRYQIKINGKWTSVTAPQEGTPDALREVGKKASLKALYEVIDIDGYVDKQGKSHKMEAKFLLANLKVHDQLMVIKKVKGGLTGFNIVLARSGSGTATTYTLLPEDSGPLPGADRVKSIRNEVGTYYAPPPPSEIRALANGCEPDDE